MERKAIPEMLHCPECGLRLVKAEWTACNMDFRICQARHLWDISTGLIGGLDFKRLPIVKCACGEESPDCHMKEIGQRRMCRKCFEREAEAWRMDGQQSFAKLEITPVITLEGTFYNLQTSVQIRPYPNPRMGGGCFGFGSAKDEAGLAKAIENFEAEAAELKKIGMVKVEVIRHDQQTVATQHKLAPEKQAEKQEQKAETKQLSLI